MLVMELNGSDGALPIDGVNCTVPVDTKHSKFIPSCFTITLFSFGCTDTKLGVYDAWMLPRHILCCELIQSQNFQRATFFMSKFMKKS